MTVHPRLLEVKQQQVVSKPQSRLLLLCSGALLFLAAACVGGRTLRGGGEGAADVVATVDAALVAEWHALADTLEPDEYSKCATAYTFCKEICFGGTYEMKLNKCTSCIHRYQPTPCSERIGFVDCEAVPPPVEQHWVEHCLRSVQKCNIAWFVCPKNVMADTEELCVPCIHELTNGDDPDDMIHYD